MKFQDRKMLRQFDIVVHSTLTQRLNICFNSNKQRLFLKTILWHNEKLEWQSKFLTQSIPQMAGLLSSKKLQRAEALSNHALWDLSC